MALDIALACGAHFAFVLLKATQQLNVVWIREGRGQRVYWIPLTAVFLGVTECVFIVKVSSLGVNLLVLGVAIGISGGVASVMAIYLHKKISKT